MGSFSKIGESTAKKSFTTAPVVNDTLSKLNAVENMQNRGSASAWFTKVEAPKLTQSEYDSEVNRLSQIRQQAAVDLDIATVDSIDKRLKALREQQGLTTFADRANDVTTAITAGSFGTAANTLGLGVNVFNDPEQYQRSINRLQTALDTGKTSDGKKLNDAQRQTIKDSIADLERKKKQAESKDSLHNKIYSFADRATDDSAMAHMSAKQGLGGVGSTIVDSAVAFGQSAVAGAIGGVTGTGMLPFMVQAFGGATQDARRNGATLEQQIAYGGAQAAKEYVSEKIFGLAVPQKLAGVSGSLDDATKKLIQRSVRNVVNKLGVGETGERILGGLATWFAGGVTEGAEELIGAWVEDYIINPNLRGYDPDDRTAQEKREDALYNMLVGGISGLMGVTNLLGYTPGTASTNTGKPQIVNATRSVEQATVSPAAAPEVQQVQAQAEVTKAQNPEADVLDAATTLFTQQGMNLKTAQTRAEIVGKLIRGEEVSDKDLNRIDPTSNQTKQIFTQLTGVQFPEGRIQIEALRNLYRSAHTVAQAARVTMKEQAIQEIQQMSAEQIVERAKQARQATTPESDKKAAQILAQARGEIAPDGTALLSYKDFAARHKQVFPDASPQETARMYDLYLKENQTISFMGRRMTRQQVRNTLRSAPDGDKLTVAELDAMFDMELEAQSRDGKDATEHSVRNKEASNGQEVDRPVQHDQQAGQPGERTGVDAGQMAQGAGREQETRPEGYGADVGRDGGPSREPVNFNAIAADGKTSFAEVEEEAWSDEMKAQTKKFSRVGVALRSALGHIPIPGTNRFCDGMSQLGVESIVQYDSPFFNFVQLSDHEVAHQYFFRDPKLFDKCLRAFKTHTSKTQRRELMARYLVDYAEVLKDCTTKEREKLQKDVFEEIICDAYADMNRAGAEANKLQQYIKPIIDEWCDARDAEMESAEKKYSIDSMTEAVGLTFEKEGQLTVFKDANGKRVDEVTEDMIRKSPLGAVLEASVSATLISDEDMGKQVKFFADLYNLMLKTQDIDLLWAVSASIGFQPIESGARDSETLNQKSKFAGYTKNSDPQYSTTVDFTTICVKTQAVIDAMSETMKRLGHGLTEQEVVEIVFRETHKADEPVPCPVCYVFSRWVGLGGLFDNMKQLQIQYANTDMDVLRADIAELESQIYDIMVERGFAIKYDKKTGKPKVNGDGREAMYKELMNRQNALQAKQNQDYINGTSGMTKSEINELAKIKNQLQILDNWAWLTGVRMSENYAPVPDEILFDINAGKEFAEQYPESWKFRTTRGPAMGKAATPYADEHLGQILRGVGVSDLNKAELGNPAKNPFLKGKNGKLTPAAQKALNSSRAKMKAQNLLNGQRYQSTSDFRFEYALDYLLSFVEMQALGGKVQLYTKVAEAVRMFASVNAEVNCSLMPLGTGYRVNKDGSKTLVFSSVTGMNAEDAFQLASEFDNVQTIMVGVGNEHIRLCMADDRINFIIPYHASGAGEARYVALMEIVGESVEDRTDYSLYQTDHKIENATENQKAAYDLRMRLLTGKLGSLKDADKQVLRENEVLHNLYKRFYRRDVDGNISDIDPKYLSAEVRESGKLFEDPECAGVFLTAEQAKTVMPFEYWDRTSTKDTADLNGQAFVDYCESLGLHPRFSGWDSRGVYHADMDFSKDSGYWKMLIDRSCYNRDGSYHEQKAIDVTNFNAGYLFREEAIKGIVQPSLVNDPTKTEKIAQKSVEQVREKRGEKKFSVASEKSGAFNLDDYDIEDLLKLSDAEFQKLYDALGIDLTIDDDILLEDDFDIEDIAEELDEDPEKIEILFRRKGLGSDYVAPEKQAVMSEKRIDERIHDSGASRPDYARKYITRISPRDFIDLTVTEKNLDRANFDTRVTGDSGGTMGDWNYEQALRDSTEPPVLDVNIATGQVIGHNGRHRMRALEMAGIESVEIEVALYDEDGYLKKYGAETISDLAIFSQFDTKTETHVFNVVPLNKAHRDEIMQSYGEKAHADAAVKYSITPAFEQWYKETYGEDVSTAHLKRRLKTAERRAAEAEHDKKAAELKNTIDSEMDLTAWMIHHTKKMREQKRDMNTKLDEARKAKAEAVRAAVAETKVVERAKAEVQHDADRMAERRNAAKRLRVREDAYKQKVTEMKENQKLKRNAAKATLRDSKLAVKRRAEIEAEQGVVDTIRKNPKQRTTVEKLQETAQNLRTLGRTAYRNFVNQAAAIDAFSKRQAEGMRAGTLVNIVGGTASTVEATFKTGLVDRSGNRIGDSMSDVFLCWDEKHKKVNEGQQALLQDFMLHWHNIDRMSIVARAESALETFELNHEWLRDMDPKEFARLTAMTEKELEKNGQYEAQQLAFQYHKLLRDYTEAANKPIFADDKGNSVTAETSQRIVDQYLEEHPWLLEKANGIYEWWDRFMREWAVGDTISEAEYERMHTMYPHYVPTYRADKSGVGGANFVGAGGANVSKAVKKAKGSHSEVMNIEDSFSNIVSKIIRLNRVNELYMNIIDTAMLDNDGLFSDMAYFDWDSSWQSGEYGKALLDGELTETVDDAVTAGLEKVGSDYKLTGWLNGRKYTTFISEELYKSIGNVTGHLANDFEEGLLKAGNFLTSPMKTAITGINPSFAIRNLSRDLPTAIINSISGLKFPEYYAQAAKEIVKNSDHWKTFQALGGTHATYYNDNQGYAKAMSRRQNPASWTVGKLGAFNEVTEAQTRFAEYLATIDRLGDTYENRLQGIKNAAEVTVDFSRKGRYGKVINAWVPYWNPAVQGIDKTIRSVIDSPDGSAVWKQASKTLGRAALTTVLVEAVLYGVLEALDRDDEWEELNDRTKAAYYCIPLKDSKTFLKIPKNREWGAILGTPFMHMLEWANGRENPFENYIETAIEPNFLPPAIFRPDAGGGFTTDVIGFSQMNDLSKNEDFAGRTIVPYSYQQGTLSQQYDSETSWVAKKLGQLFNWSPMQIDYIIGDYFGDFGDMFIQATSEARKQGEQNLGEAALDILTSPFLADARYSNYAVNKYYDLTTELGKVVQDKKNQLGTDAAKETIEYQTDKALDEMFGKQITELNRYVRDLPDGEEKDAVKEQIAQLAKDAIEFYEDSMAGKVSNPIRTAEYHDFSETVSKELIRMDAFSGDYKFTPTGNPSSKYNDPDDEKNREYILTDEQKAYFKQLYREKYNEIFEDLIQSSKYKKKKDSEKAELLEDARDDVLDATKEEFFEWLDDTGVRSTKKQK